MAKRPNFLYTIIQKARCHPYPVPLRLRIVAALTSRKDFIYILKRLQFLLRQNTRLALAKLFSFIPFTIAMKSIHLLQNSQGFGVGHKISTSGEIGALKTIFQGKELCELILFDVGAHVGDYTLQLLQLFPNARVFAFEPSQPSFELLKTRVQHNQIVLLNHGLAENIGTYPLYKDVPLSRIASLTRFEKASNEPLELVSMKRLDDAFPAFGLEHIDLLKIDVEGHELDVLHGSEQLLKKRIVQNIQFEFGESNIATKISFKDIFEYLSQHDFAISIVKHGRLVRLPTYKPNYEVFLTTNLIAQLN